jgi:uncharacterized membrane protein
MIGSLAWPLLLGAAWSNHAAHQVGERSLWAVVVYMAAGRVCHQQPERSFYSDGAQWPVCARCAGLYLAAPVAAAWVLTRRRRMAPMDRPAYLAMAVAAVPTVVTLAWEWGGLGTPPNLVRFVSALPLGAAIAWALFTVTHRID